MQIVFHSNYMNHHQRPFVEYLAENGCQVTFVAHAHLSEERKALGYSTELQGVRHIQYNEENAGAVRDLTLEADAVIFGTKPKPLYQERVRSGKLTFNYSERLFKKSMLQKYSPYYQLRLRKLYVFERKNAPYVMAAGAYAAQDYKSLGYPKDRFLKWGYFPPLTQAPLPELLQHKQENTIVWTARFIDWKHPEYVVELGLYLRKQNVPFHIKMIGTGELLDKTKKAIDSCGLTERIEVVGALPPEQVRQEFEKAQIALLTSDRNEGWGAVVNEAMNSACAIVAYRGVGSVSYLVQDGENGMTFETKRELFQKVEQLLRNQQQCKKLGENAYHTVADLWNYQVAAERLIEFIRERAVKYSSGPMSQG